MRNNQRIQKLGKGEKKRELYIAAFGGHLFLAYFYQCGVMVMGGCGGKGGVISPFATKSVAAQMESGASIYIMANVPITAWKMKLFGRKEL